MKDVATLLPVAERSNGRDRNERLKASKQSVVTSSLTNGDPSAVVNGHGGTTPPDSDVDSFEDALLHVSDSSDCERVSEVDLSDDEPGSSELSLAGSTATTATTAGSEAPSGNELPSSSVDAASTGKDDASTGKDDASTGKDDASTGIDDESTGKDDASTGKDDASTGKDDESTGKDDASTGKDDESTGKDDASTEGVMSDVPVEESCSSAGDVQSSAAGVVQSSSAGDVQSSSASDVEFSSAVEDSTPAVEDSTPAVVAAVENGERSGASTPDCVIINESRSEAIVDSNPSALASSKEATDDRSSGRSCDTESIPEQDKVEEECSKVEEEPSVVASVDEGADHAGKSEVVPDIDIVDLEDAENEPVVGTKENVVLSDVEEGENLAIVDGRSAGGATIPAKKPAPIGVEIPVIDIDDSSSESDACKSSTAEVAVAVTTQPEARDNTCISDESLSSEDDDRLQLDSSGSLFDEQAAAAAAKEEEEEEGNELKNAQELETGESDATLMKSDCAVDEISEATAHKTDGALSEVDELIVHKTDIALSEVVELPVHKTDIALSEVAESTVDKTDSASSEVLEMTVEKADRKSAKLADASADASADEADCESLEVAEPSGDQPDSKSAKNAEDIVDKLDSESAKDAKDFVDKVDNKSAEVADDSADKADCLSLEVPELVVDKLDNTSAEVADSTADKVDDGSAEVIEATADKLDGESREVADISVDEKDSESADLVVQETDNRLSEIAESSVHKPDAAVSEIAESTVHKPDSALPEIAEATVDTLQLSNAEVEQADGTASDDVEVQEQKEKPILSSALEIVQETLERIFTAATVDGTDEKSDNAVKDDCPKQDEISPKLARDEVMSIGDDSNGVDASKDEALAAIADAVPVKSPDDASTADSPAEISATLDNDGDIHAIKIDKKHVDGNAGCSSSENDDSKTLLDVTPKPDNENNMTTTEGPCSKGAKRGTSPMPQDTIPPKRIKNNGEDQTPNGVRNTSKENLNPAAQKRGTTASSELEDEVKKARLDTLRERKPSKKRQEMSNLDKAIARVASGGLSIREQEIGKLVKQLAAKSIENISVTQLEDLVQYKIAQFVSDMSECASYRREIARLKLEVEKSQTSTKMMSKQVRDLENVMKKMMTDIKNLPKDALPIPAKVNRSVGLQVGDGRISNEQKKLAMMPPRPADQPPTARRHSGILTNRPSPATSAPAQPPPAPQMRLRPAAHSAPPQAPLVTLPKRVVSTNPPALSPANRLPTSLTPFNTPPKQQAPGLAPAASSHVGAGIGLMTRQLRPAQPAQPAQATSRQTGLIDLTDESPSPAPRQMAAGARQTGPPKLRVITPINPAGSPGRRLDGSIRLVSQSSLTAPPSARVAYMVPASATGGEPRMYFSATAPKVSTSNGGNVLTVSRPNNIPSKTVIYSTNIVQAAQAQRGPGFKQLMPVPSSRPTVGLPGRPRAERRTMHPAPLPLMPTVSHSSTNPNWKKPPPHPDLKISKCDKRSRGENGIILSWKMDSLSSDHEEISSYQLYAYQETSGEPNTSMWKKVGDVKSMALPMACTLTQFTEGNKYHFAVRAVDARGRTGPFSRPGNILLSTLDD